MHSHKCVLCYSWLFFSMLGCLKNPIYVPLHYIYVAKFSPSEEIRSGGRDDCFKVEQCCWVKGAQSTEHLMGFACPPLHPFNCCLLLGFQELFRLNGTATRKCPESLILLILTVKFRLGRGSMQWTPVAGLILSEVLHELHRLANAWAC